VSRTRPTEREVKLMLHRCRLCDQPPGVWCTTSNGFWSVLLHSARFYDWKRAQAADKEAHRAGSA
jgi:hypothetical protein